MKTKRRWGMAPDRVAAALTRWLGVLAAVRERRVRRQAPLYSILCLTLLSALPDAASASIFDPDDPGPTNILLNAWYDADSRRTGTTNAAQEVTLERWDGRGQQTNWVDPASQTVQRSYDEAGNQITLTNRRGKGWRFQFDAANGLTNTITPLNRQAWQLWDKRGLLSALKGPSSQWTTNFHDARGRLTNVTDGAGVRLFGYDGNNNLTSVVEAGKTNTWGLDAYDQVKAFTSERQPTAWLMPPIWNRHRGSFLEFAALRLRQVRHLMYSSERLKTRATTHPVLSRSTSETPTRAFPP